MKVLYSVIAEDAQLRNDGRMDVHGIFHELYARGFPAQQERLTLVTTIEWDESERGAIDFAVNLLDPDRGPVLTINAQTQVEDQYAVHRPARTQMAIPIDQLIFPRAGEYEFELTVGETKQALAPIYLIEDPDAHCRTRPRRIQRAAAASFAPPPILPARTSRPRTTSGLSASSSAEPKSSSMSLIFVHGVTASTQGRRSPPPSG